MIPRGLPSSHAERSLLFPSPLPEITWEREENLWFQGLQVPGSQPPPPCTSCMLSVFSASLSQRCSSGFSLHMFLKLSWSASKRQMVVWLNIFPVRARQAGHYTPHSFPCQWLPTITTHKLALFLGDHERHSPCSFSRDLKALKHVSVRNCNNFKPVPCELKPSSSSQIWRYPGLVLPCLLCRSLRSRNH